MPNKYNLLLGTNINKRKIYFPRKFRKLSGLLLLRWMVISLRPSIGMWIFGWNIFFFQMGMVEAVTTLNSLKGMQMRAVISPEYNWSVLFAKTEQLPESSVDFAYFGDQNFPVFYKTLATGSSLEKRTMMDNNFGYPFNGQTHLGINFKGQIKNKPFFQRIYFGTYIYGQINNPIFSELNYLMLDQLSSITVIPVKWDERLSTFFFINQGLQRYIHETYTIEEAVSNEKIEPLSKVPNKYWLTVGAQMRWHNEIYGFSTSLNALPIAGVQDPYWNAVTQIQTKNVCPQSKNFIYCQVFIGINLYDSTSELGPRSFQFGTSLEVKYFSLNMFIDEMSFLNFTAKIDFKHFETRLYSIQHTVNGASLNKVSNIGLMTRALF